jgi:hypothetical protein
VCAEQFMLVGIFGQTEAISCHRFWPDVWPDKYLATAPAVNYVGIPNPLLASTVMDADGKHLLDEPGVAGEAVYRSPAVTSGYYKDQAATEEAFRHGWFHSGDSCVVDDDGLRIMVDRYKDIIKSGGENVSSLRVEAVLHQHPDVAKAAVVGLPHDRWGEAVTAIVVREPGRQPPADELIAFCRERLAGFESPKAVLFADGAWAGGSSASGAGDHRHLCTRLGEHPLGADPQILVAGRGHLLAAGQVHPQLQGVRVFVAEGKLTVDDAAARGHPLHVTRPEHTGAAQVVAVLKCAVEHDSHRLQPAVRVPFEARIREPVFGKQQERVGEGEVPGRNDQRLVVDLGVRAEWRHAMGAVDPPGHLCAGGVHGSSGGRRQAGCGPAPVVAAATRPAIPPLPPSCPGRSAPVSDGVRCPEGPPTRPGALPGRTFASVSQEAHRA